MPAKKAQSPSFGMLAFLIAIILIILVFGGVFGDIYTPKTAVAPETPYCWICQSTPTPVTAADDDERADLRHVIIFLIPDLPDMREICDLHGGVWREEYVFVGCDGGNIPPLPCNSPDVVAMRTACLNAGAEFVCDLDNFYCRYA